MQIGKQTHFMQGNEACAEGALAAGANFFAGYPITPATEIAETLSRKLPFHGGRYIQMEDELACMGAVIGAALAGAKSLTATSGPGFTLIQEALGYATMAEVPCVVIAVQRGGPSTGLPTLPSQGDVMMSRWGTHGDHPIIVLSPSSVSECFSLTFEAFNLSERYRNPVIVLSDAIIGHMREKVDIPHGSEKQRIERKKPTVSPSEYRAYRPDEDGVPPMANIGDGYRHFRHGCPHDEFGKIQLMDTDLARKLLSRLHDKILQNRNDVIRYETHAMEDANTVVIAYGCVARPAMAAVEQARKSGLKVGLFRPITLWPSPDCEILEITKNVENIIIPEMNTGQYASEISRIFGEAGRQVKIVKLNEIGNVLIYPDRISRCIREVCR